MDGTVSPCGDSKSMPDPTSEAENSQGGSNSNSQDVQVKEEPEDDGYEPTSSANSRTSSPLPPVHFGLTSPQQSNASTDQTEHKSNSDKALQNNACSKNYSHNQSAKVSRRMNSVQNIVEGLRRKSESQLTKAKCSESGPSANKSNAVAALKNREPCFPQNGEDSVFPISQNLQARVSRNGKNVSHNFTQSIARPKSPTGKSRGLLKDLTHFTYSLMESSVNDIEAAEIFNVQKHELVCAIGSKSLVSGKSNKVLASLDFGHYWCNFCPYSTNNKTALIQHVLEHRFSCRYCPYESFCRSDTMRHMHEMHYDFKVSAGHFMYCTLLSDYMRVKARVQGKTDKDSDEDVGDTDINDMDVQNTDHPIRKRKHAEDHPHDAKSVRSSLDSPSATPTWSDSESILKEKGKSRKSQNPKKHAPSNEIEHFDIFDMEVEEKTRNQQRSLVDNVFPKKKLPLSEQNSTHPETEVLPPGTMQVLPTMTDGSLQTFTSKRTEPSALTPSQPPKANFSYRGRKNVSAAGSASNLYWSCGYCTFQGNGQAEIKEHSNKNHPGKPHRYVALIKNMAPDTYIPHGAQAANKGRPQPRPVSITPQTNGAQNSVDTDDIAPVNEKEGSHDLLKVKINFPKPKRENITYRCYHCSYTAKRHSSLKTHLYHKHRGKGLVAVEEESETGQQTFFCARDDCTFKSDNPSMYLNHVDQCTPWNKPELADVEVEPHIRECLDQTIAFAETAREKVSYC
ncbi:hypothetical protein ElyMa_005116500 [Elysia marginata]|uniref:C2H2-type domain-containing protein n=1 Tax=Elysia marginata TaxID=1093978 RepID=A0AAV4JKH0_9GAST|nr:hypothetical protein ElyMa_005116500 [Elysia marginata]